MTTRDGALGALLAALVGAGCGSVERKEDSAAKALLEGRRDDAAILMREAAGYRDEDTSGVVVYDAPARPAPVMWHAPPPQPVPPSPSPFNDK